MIQKSENLTLPKVDPIKLEKTYKIANKSNIGHSKFKRTTLKSIAKISWRILKNNIGKVAKEALEMITINKIKIVYSIC